MTDQYPPPFATNRPNKGETVAAEVNILLAGAREHLAVAPDVAIATAYLNPGGFVLVADELEQVPRVRLLLGAEPDPTTTQPANVPVSDELVVEALSRHADWLTSERDLTGFTRLEDDAARRLVKWLRSTGAHEDLRVEVRRYTKGFLHGKAYITEHPAMPAVLAGSSNFTYAGLARNAELNLGYPAGGQTHLVQEWFNEFWDESEPFDLAGLYSHRWDPHSPWVIFLRMLWEYYGAHLRDDDDSLVRTQLHLTGYQREGVARMLRLLEANGGVVVADEVGLGKTYMAGEVIARASGQDRQHVLIVSPAALKAAMWDPFLKQHDFSRRVDVMSYDQLRISWNEDPDEARRMLDEYAMVVVDEAHNLRNPNAQRTEALNALVGGVNPKKLVLLTATPVNNSLYDLHALVALFIRNDAAFASVGIPSIRKYIQRAQEMDPDSLSPEHLFDLMDQVAVRRTRQFIKAHYSGDTFEAPDGTQQTIQFPTPQLKRLDYNLDDTGTALLEAVVYALDNPDDDHIGFASRYEQRVLDPDRLLLARYTSGAYSVDGSPAQAYQLSNAGLLRSSLLKRLESSALALANTLGRLIGSHKAFLDALDSGWVLAGDALREWTSSGADDFDEFLAELDDVKSTQVDDAANYHEAELRRDVTDDLELLQRLKTLADGAASYETDQKAVRLVERLREIATEAAVPSKSGVSSGDRLKTIVFSTFADTIDSLHRRLADFIDQAADDDPIVAFRDRVAPAVYGSSSGADQDSRSRTLARFAPQTAGDGSSDDLYDLLFTTDVLSEGVNLQQAGHIVNYDLPWNPMRIVQRHGRIDRIGSSHSRIHLDCFFPAEHLDKLLRLEERLHRKLAQADAAVGTGQVLPGVEAGQGQVFADNRDQINKLYNEDGSILEARHAALSGEEYRQRLRKATGADVNIAVIERLPYGSGSGFVNPRIQQPGYVFCIWISGQDKARFRFVPTGADWRPLSFTDEHGAEHHSVVDDTLTALIAADPVTEDTERELPEKAFEGVFDAWAVAKSHVYEEWKLLADGTALLPDVPKSLRDAAQMVYSNEAALGSEDQGELLERLNTNPPVRVQRQIRQILNTGDSVSAQLADVLETLRDAGIEPATAPPDLSAIDEHDIRLVSWMAVSAGSVGAGRGHT